MSSDNEQAHPHYQHAVQQVKDHKFITMVAGSIVLAGFLVFAAMALYNSSGAAQLDWSRPGYEAVRKQAQKSDTVVSYPSTGQLDQSALDEFEKKYDAELSKIKQQDAFASDILSQKSLQIDQDSASTAGTNQAPVSQ